MKQISMMTPSDVLRDVSMIIMTSQLCVSQHPSESNRLYFQRSWDGLYSKLLRVLHQNSSFEKIKMSGLTFSHKSIFYKLPPK